MACGLLWVPWAPSKTSPGTPPTPATVRCPTVAWTRAWTPGFRKSTWYGVGRCRKGGVHDARIPPKLRAPWVHVGKPSQQVGPWPSVPGKFVTKPKSYVAALRSVPHHIRYHGPYARRGLDRGVADTKGEGGGVHVHQYKGTKMREFVG